MLPIRLPSRETLQTPVSSRPVSSFFSPLSSDKTIPGFISLWKLAFGGRRAENKSFEYTLLMFISALSLRVGRGGGGRAAGGGAHCAADGIGFVCDEWACHGRWQVCVQYMWMYNTLCIPRQAGSPYLFIYLISSQIISISLHLWLLLVEVVTKLRHLRHKLWHIENI